MAGTARSAPAGASALRIDKIPMNIITEEPIEINGSKKVGLKNEARNTGPSGTGNEKQTKKVLDRRSSAGLGMRPGLVDSDGKAQFLQPHFVRYVTKRVCARKGDNLCFLVPARRRFVFLALRARLAWPVWADFKI